MLKKSKEEFRLVILILLHNTKLSQKEIAKISDITPKTVSKIKKRYLEEGLESALNDRLRSGQPKNMALKKKLKLLH